MMSDDTDTVTRATLALSVAEDIDLGRQEAASMVETVLNIITESLARGEPVKLSSFGAFGLRDKTARMGRNPKTGEEVPISPRRVLVFRPSQILKDRVNAR